MLLFSMTHKETLVTYEALEYKDNTKYLNSSCDKEYNGTQFL